MSRLDFFSYFLYYELGDRIIYIFIYEVYNIISINIVDVSFLARLFPLFFLVFLYSFSLASRSISRLPTTVIQD